MNTLRSDGQTCRNKRDQLGLYRELFVCKKIYHFTINRLSALWGHQDAVFHRTA